MAKRPFTRAGAPVEGAGNDNIASPPIPAAHLLYFTGIADASDYAALNGKLFLTHGEISGPSEDHNFLLAHAINVPDRKKFGQFLKDLGHTPHPDTQFLPVWQGGIGKFSVEDMAIITFLMKESTPVLKYIDARHKLEFGIFTAYWPHSAKEADTIAKWAVTQKTPERFLLVFNETMFEKSHIRELQAMGKCHVAPATPEIVFHPDGKMRARLAFPHLFGNGPKGDKPEPKV